MKKIDFSQYADIVNLLKQNKVSIHSIRFAGDTIFIVIDNYCIPSNVLGCLAQLFKYKLSICATDGEFMFELRLIEG